MPSARTRLLLVSSTLVSGVLAGGMVAHLTLGLVALAAVAVLGQAFTPANKVTMLLIYSGIIRRCPQEPGRLTLSWLARRTENSPRMKPLSRVPKSSGRFATSLHPTQDPPIF
jgi:hypothetical protein